MFSSLHSASAEVPRVATTVASELQSKQVSVTWGRRQVDIYICAAAWTKTIFYSHRPQTGVMPFLEVSTAGLLLQGIDTCFKSQSSPGSASNFRLGSEIRLQFDSVLS